MDVIRVQFPSVLNRTKLENKSMVDDKVARRSLWVGELACSSRAYHTKIFKNPKSGVMAEWLMRGTVNTFFQRFNSS